MSFGNINMPWKCTDGDNLQFGKRLSTYKFEFKEFNRKDFPNEFRKARKGEDYDDSFYIIDTIDLEEYTVKEILDYTEFYYDNLDEIANIYVKDFTWIVCECIFEQKSGLY